MAGTPARTVRLTPAARRDLEAIWDFTAGRWSVAQAETYLRGLSALFGTLAAFPEVGRERREITPPVRLHPYRAHLVVYRVETDQLLIIRVLHGRQNWPALLDG